MNRPSQPRRLTTPNPWQRLPYGPAIAVRRTQQAYHLRRTSGTGWAASGLVAVCGALALAVRWPGV